MTPFGAILKQFKFSEQEEMLFIFLKKLKKIELNNYALFIKKFFKKAIIKA